jgi:hypothetical protein
VSAPSRLPDALRRRIADDLEPVRPLAAPNRRALLLVLPVALALGVLPMFFLERHGAPLWSAIGGGISLVELIAGALLLWLALRDAVPGLGLGAKRASLALAGGLGVQLLIGLAIWGAGGALAPSADRLLIGWQCARAEGFLGLPILTAALWLGTRALPIRPRWSGALAGAAAGLLADAVWHLFCGRTDLLHVLVWHFGVTWLLTVVGFFAGSLWDGRRRPVN